jgi:hypothetical protein
VLIRIRRELAPSIYFSKNHYPNYDVHCRSELLEQWFERRVEKIVRKLEPLHPEWFGICPPVIPPVMQFQL